MSPLVDLEAAIHVSDLALDRERVTVLNEPEELVARVMPPRAVEEVVVEAVEGEEAEAEEGAEEAGEGAEAPATEGATPSEDEG